MADINLEQLSQEIYTRFDELGKRVSDERIREIVRESLPSLANDPEFVRKMKFGGGHDARLLGTKYYRWGLTLGDVEWLFDMQESLRGQRRPNGGFYEGPSETLHGTFQALSEAFYLP